jgi:hypothetical protein
MTTIATATALLASLLLGQAGASRPTADAPPPATRPRPARTAPEDIPLPPPPVLPAPKAQAGALPPVDVPMPPPPSPGQARPASKTPPAALFPIAPAPVKLPSGAKGGAVRVAVTDPTVLGQVPPRPLAAFVQSLAPEVRKLQGVSAMGYQDIRDMVGLEKQRQMLGCSQDEACLAEIGGALGADEMLTTSLSLEGRSYVLSAQRVDLRKAKVIHSEVRRFDQRDGEELLVVVGPLVAALYPDRPLKEGKTRGVAREAFRRLNPPPIPVWTFVATAGAGVAAAGAGVIFGLSAKDFERKHNQMAASTLPVSGSDLNALRSSAVSQQQKANALLITSGAFLLAAGVEAFFTDWHGDRGMPFQPVPLQGGGGLVVGGSF